MGLFSSKPPPVRIPAQPGDWILIEHPYLPGNYEEVQRFSFYPVIAWRRDDDLARYYPESLDMAEVEHCMDERIRVEVDGARNYYDGAEIFYIRGGVMWHQDGTCFEELSTRLMDWANHHVVRIGGVPMELREVVIPAIDRSMKNMVAGHHYPMLY